MPKAKRKLDAPSIATANSLLQIIVETRCKTSSSLVPPGFKDTEQWASEWGLSRSRAGTHLVDACRLGVMERITLKKCCRGLMRRVYFYAAKANG